MEALVLMARPELLGAYVHRRELDEFGNVIEEMRIGFTTTPGLFEDFTYGSGRHYEIRLEGYAVNGTSSFGEWQPISDALNAQLQIHRGVHAVTSTSPNLIQAADLEVQNAAHAVSSESPTLQLSTPRRPTRPVVVQRRAPEPTQRSAIYTHTAQPGAAASLAITAKYFGEAWFNDASHESTSFSADAGTSLLVIVGWASQDDIDPARLTCTSNTTSGPTLTWDDLVQIRDEPATAAMFVANVSSAWTGTIEISSDSTTWGDSPVEVLQIGGAETVWAGDQGIASGSGTPSTAILTTRANSHVIAIATDYYAAGAPTIDTGSFTAIRSRGSGSMVYMIWRTTNAVALSGTTVTMAWTDATPHNYNIAAVEVRTV